MAASIEEAIAAIDEELAWCARTGDRGGYFAAVYRAVTVRVRDGLAAGEFDDAERVEHFDVLFARRYLDARAAWRAGRTPTAAWQLAFDAAAHDDCVILQHVLLGINAHINLDLGIAAADAGGQGELHLLRGDFEKINDVLAELVDRMQSAIGTVSPWGRLVDLVGLRFDETLVCYVLQRARADAWEFADTFATSTTDGRASLLLARDRDVAALGNRIALPPAPLRWAVRFARSRETHDLDQVIRDLAAGELA